MCGYVLITVPCSSPCDTSVSTRIWRHSPDSPASADASSSISHVLPSTSGFVCGVSSEASSLPVCTAWPTRPRDLLTQLDSALYFAGGAERPVLIVLPPSPHCISHHMGRRPGFYFSYIIAPMASFIRTQYLNNNHTLNFSFKRSHIRNLQTNRAIITACTLFIFLWPIICADLV